MTKIVSEVSPLTSLKVRDSWKGRYSTSLSFTLNPDILSPLYFLRQQKKVLLAVFEDFAQVGRELEIIGPATPAEQNRRIIFIKTKREMRLDFPYEGRMRIT